MTPLSVRSRTWLDLIVVLFILDVVGLFYGSDAVARYCVAALVIAPIFATIGFLALRLGPQVLGR